MSETTTDNGLFFGTWNESTLWSVIHVYMDAAVLSRISILLESSPSGSHGSREGGREGKRERERREGERERRKDSSLVNMFANFVIGREYR